MAEVQLPSREPSAHNFFSNAHNISDAFLVAVRDGVDLISLIISAKEATLPQSHPKQLKDELVNKLSDHRLVESLTVTRQGKIILTTRSTATAQELLNIDTLLGVEVSTFIQIETITTRFLLRLDCAVSCSDVADELTEQGLAIYEVRRFMRGSPDGPLPTPSVLVSCIGTSLPPEVRLWYQVHQITNFYDKPRQCSTCHRFTHSARACRATAKICISCATAHTGDCSTQELCCINCKGAHAANNKDCPTYQREVRLQKFCSDRHLTIREARHQFRDQTSTKTYAKVVSNTPSDAVTKADFKEAIQSVTSQFTDMVQQLVAGFRHAISELVDSLTVPLQAIMQELQSRKPNKTTLTSLTDMLAQRAKKIKAYDFNLSDVPSPMDTQSQLLLEPTMGHQCSGSSNSGPG